MDSKYVITFFFFWRFHSVSLQTSWGEKQPSNLLKSKRFHKVLFRNGFFWMVILVDIQLIKKFTKDWKTDIYKTHYKLAKVRACDWWMWICMNTEKDSRAHVDFRATGWIAFNERLKFKATPSNGALAKSDVNNTENIPIFKGQAKRSTDAYNQFWVVPF